MSVALSTFETQTVPDMYKILDIHEKNQPQSGISQGLPGVPLFLMSFTQLLTS